MEYHGSDIVLAVVMAIITGVFSILWWFIRRQFASNERMHEHHYKHSTDMELHETERERTMREDQRNHLAEAVIEHGRLDDQRFGRMDGMLDEIRQDIKHILSAVNSK